MEMSESDLIWLAGLLEGEGTFDMHKGRYPRIRVGMTDRDVVGRAATLMGASIRMTMSTVGHKATFHAEKSGAEAAALMRALLPYLGARRSATIGVILGTYARLNAGVESTAIPGPPLVRIPGVPRPI